jgi:hypothetical protein
VAITAAAPSAPDEPGRLFLVASYVVLVLLCAVLGLLGTFLLAAGPHLGKTLALPIGLAIAVFGHPAAAYLGLELTGSRAGTLAPLAGWSLVVLPLSSGTAEGDVVLPGNLLSIAYLMLGVATFGIAAVLTRPIRGRTAIGRR